MNYLKEYHWPGNVRELKTMLNSIVDLFGQVSPTRAMIEAIRNYRRDGLVHSGTMDDDISLTLQAQWKNRVVEVQNILREIKIELRPVINNQLSGKGSTTEIKQIQSKLMQKVYIMEDLCREPILFKDLELFDNIKRFRYILEKSITQWPKSLPGFLEIWHRELESLHDEINKEIFKLIYRNTDM